jgi:hypothetical protein
MIERNNSPKGIDTSLNGCITGTLLKHISLMKMKIFTIACFKLLFVKRRPVNAEDAVALLEEEESGSQANTARAARYDGRLLRSHVTLNLEGFFLFFFWMS